MHVNRKPSVEIHNSKLWYKVDSSSLEQCRKLDDRFIQERPHSVEDLLNTKVAQPAASVQTMYRRETIEINIRCDLNSSRLLLSALEGRGGGGLFISKRGTVVRCRGCADQPV